MEWRGRGGKKSNGPPEKVVVGEGTAGREGGRGGGAGAAGADQRAPASLGPLRQKPAGNRGAPSRAKPFGGCFSIHISICPSRPPYVHLLFSAPPIVCLVHADLCPLCELLPSLHPPSLPPFLLPPSAQAGVPRRRPPSRSHRPFAFSHPQH